MSKIKVLYIDDELVNLLAFKASFRRNFEVFTARSADEGIEILKQHPIAVLISDQKMPDKTGVDFFESILETFPSPIRILITAYSDVKAIVDAINKGRVYQYITKPWNNLELQITIENAYQLYQLKEQNKSLNLKYKNIFSESSDPIILVEPGLKIIDFNSATENLIGNKDLKLSSFASYFIDTTEAQKVITIIREKKFLEDYQCQMITPSGEKKVCLISGNIITNSYNEFVSYQLVIKDITERSKLNQLLLKKVIETQEQERERISRDLHDGIGQSLAALKLNFNYLKSNYSKNIDIEDQLNEVPQIIDDTIKELRRICFDTLPLVLKEYGLLKAIKELQSKNSHPDFNIIFNANADLQITSESLEISIFRIIQEFLNNSIKHSGATELNIELSEDKDTIFLNLRDNGVGFNPNDWEQFKGYGLKNIKNRVESFNGTIALNSAINKGTIFNFTFPLH